MISAYVLLWMFFAAFVALVGVCHIAARRERRLAKCYGDRIFDLKNDCDKLRTQRDSALAANEAALSAVHQAYEANLHLIMMVQHQRVQLVKLQHGHKDVPLLAN